MGDLNRRVFDAINGWPQGLAPVMRFFSEATNALWVKIALGAILLALLSKPGKTRRTGVQALVAFPLADGLTHLLKNLFPMHRPFQEISSSEMVLRSGWSDSAGTASAHSANMASVAFVFVYHLGWWGSPWVLVALVTGLSRIYNGVHYPYQVLLGWTCGVLVAFLVTKAGDLILKKRGSVVMEETPNEVEPA